MPDHVMLDIETMGTKKNAAILSIAAVRFDLDDKLIHRNDIFYQRIDPEYYDGKQGFSLSMATLKWWMEQANDVRTEAWGGTRPLNGVLEEFVDWISSEDLYVWGHGKDFDVPIVENALASVGLKVPWRFYKTLDTRTAYFLSQEKSVKPEFPVDGYPKHHPVGDCIAQIEALFQAVHL